MMLFILKEDKTREYKRSRVIFIGCETTNDLLKKISKCCNVQKQFLIAKLKHVQINARILDGWRMSKYPIQDYSQIIVEIIDKGQKGISEQNSQNNIDMVEKIEKTKSNENNVVKTSDTKSKILFETSDLSQYFQNELQKFTNAVRNKNKNQIYNILNKEPQCSDQILLKTIMEYKRTFLLNENGKDGYAAIHLAIHQNDQKMLQLLLGNYCDPNVVSGDGYTPLQLTIGVDAYKLAQILLYHPKIDINKVTKKGTALHFALASKKDNFLKLLIENKANLYIEDDKQITPFDLFTQQQYKNLMPKKTIKQIMAHLKGKIYQVSGFMSMQKQRLLFVNPYKNLMLVYKNSYNQQPQYKIIISKIEKIDRKTQLSWSMKQDRYYFSIHDEKQQYLFCVKNLNILQQWVKSLQKCRKYCIQNKTKKNTQQNQDQYLMKTINDQQNKVKTQKIKITKQKQKNNNVDKIKNNNKKNFKKKYFIQIQDLIMKQNQQNIIQSTNNNSSNILPQIIDKPDKPKYATVIPKPSSQIQTDDQTDHLRQNMISGTSIPSIQKKQQHIFPKSSVQPQLIVEQPKQLIRFSDFDIIRQIGQGSFGKVFLTKYRKQQKLYALKVQNKKKLINQKQLKYAVIQTNMLKRIDHPFIIKLYYSFQTHANLYLVLDYCPFGNLTTLLSQQQNCTEDIIKFYIAQLVIAIQYLHSHNVIYRDLKPQNILISKTGYIKLIDFNLCKENNSVTSSFCGSLAYLSPEMLQKKAIGPQADIYGIGCVFYEMIAGYPPYFDDDAKILEQNIKNGKLKFPQDISKNAKNLIMSLLQRNVSKRININEIKKHEFFKNFIWQHLQKQQMELPNNISKKLNKNKYLLETGKIQQCKFNDHDYQNTFNMSNKIKNWTFVREK